MQILEVSTLQVPELQLDLSTLQGHVLPREVSKPQGPPELHLDVATIKRSVLLLELSTSLGLSCI